MSVDDVEEPRVADSEETIDERNGDTEGPLLSEVTGSNTQDPEGEPGEDFQPSSSENIVSNDQEEKEEIDLVKATEDLDKEKARDKRKISRPAQDKLAIKLQSELKKQIDRTRSLQDTVKGIQRQLVRIDKTLYSVKKEHEIIRKKHAQFNSLQKTVDSIDKSIRTWKLKPAITKRKTKPKL
jgi:hypothetical protein